MANLLSLFSGDYQLSSKVSELIIAPLNDEGSIDNDLGGEKVLQYWPDSIEDEMSANWQDRSIPGSAIPLYQWVSGSGHNFSFSTVFSRDLNGEIGKDIEEDKFNVDVDAAVAWLSMLCMNDYQDVGGVQKAAVAPPVLWLWMKGTNFGYNTTAIKALGTSGSDVTSTGIYCILLNRSVTRKNWFQDGQLRLASVSLSFAEVMQIGQSIYPYGRSQVKPFASKYTRVPSR